MSIIDSIKSILTQSALVSLCEKYHIPGNVHLELPGPNARLRYSPTSKIGVYSRFFDFDNYQIPLSLFFVDVLAYFQINLSQLSVIAAAKVSHIEILCHVHGFVSTVDSLKNWNDHFFWVDDSVFPLVVSWHNDKTMRKDPYPTPAEFNVDECNYLVDNPAPFRNFLEPFFCFVGISRYYDLDKNCYSIFWANDDEEMDLFAFITHAGAGDDDVNKGDGDAVEANQNDQVEHVIDVEGIDVVANDEVQAIVADKTKRIRKTRKAADGDGGSDLPPKKLREDKEVGVTAATTVPFVTSFVTLDSIFGTGLRTRHPTKRLVISLDSSHDLNANAIDDEVTFVIRSSMPHPLVLTAVVATTVTTDVTSASVYGSGARQAQPSIFRDFASPSAAKADVSGPSQPVGMDYEELLAKFNVRATRQVCFNTKIGMRLEHELRDMQRFEERCAMQANWLKERDPEIASLKTQLSLKEAEAAEAIRLCGQIENVEAAGAAKVNELNHLGKRNVAFKGQVTALEFAAASKDAELASSNSQVAKVTRDLSNLQLSYDELSVEASSLEFVKDKLID
nr:putative transposase (putative), gypsy type [Tanacetum cinerariifolium]